MAANLRDQIRAGIFSSEHKPKRVPFTFFGQEIELVQPDVDTVLSIQAMDDRKSGMVRMIILYARVPGTDDPVFEEGDAEALLKLPFGKDFTALNEAIQKLSDVEVLTKDAVKNSEATSSNSN